MSPADTSPKGCSACQKHIGRSLSEPMPPDIASQQSFAPVGCIPSAAYRLRIGGICHDALARCHDVPATQLNLRNCDSGSEVGDSDFLTGVTLATPFAGWEAGTVRTSQLDLRARQIKLR